MHEIFFTTPIALAMIALGTLCYAYFGFVEWPQAILLAVLCIIIAALMFGYHIKLNRK